MNEKQKQLELMGKINKVIKGINAACKCEDIQVFLYNLNTVISDDPSDSKIDCNGAILYKIKPFKNIEEMHIYLDLFTSISLWVNSVTVNYTPNVSTVTTEKYQSICIECNLFDKSDKEIKEHFRNKIIEYGQKQIDASRGMIRRQLDLINKLESMVKPVAIKKESKDIVIGHHPAVELYNSPRTRRGHVELTGDRCGSVEGQGNIGHIGD